MIRIVFIIILNVFYCKAQSGTMTDARDGKTYKTIQIGSQTWMAQNLAYASEITYWATVDYLKTGIYCYLDDTTYISKYGLLYTWDVAKSACPLGWHLPSKEEFDILILNTGLDKKKVYQTLIEGGSSGFEGLLGGGLEVSSGFGDLNRSGLYWSSSRKKDSNRYYHLDLIRSAKAGSLHNDPKFHHDNVRTPFAYSVRCIKD